jgi:hypothetical protein
MVEEVMQALGGWESLDSYVTRTGHLALSCVPPEEGVVVFVDHDPWVLNFEATKIDGKTYIPTQK